MGSRSPRRPGPTSNISRSPTRWAGQRRCASSASWAKCAAVGRTCLSRCIYTIRAGSLSPMRMPGSRWGSPNSTRRSAGWAAARSPGSPRRPAPKGDHTRGLGGFGAGFFAAFNRNKRSLAVDLKRPEGQAVIHRLVPTADVVLENFGPGTMERLGCGYEQLATLNPRLVYLALKGYLAGPYEHRPALDEVVQFQTGLAFMTGPPGQPLRAGASVIDIMGAVFGVVAAQAALRERELSGKGQRVSSALFESAAFLMSTHMAGMTATGLEARPMPARRGAWAGHGGGRPAADARPVVGG